MRKMIPILFCITAIYSSSYSMNTPSDAQQIAVFFQNIDSETLDWRQLDALALTSINQPYAFAILLDKINEVLEKRLQADPDDSIKTNLLNTVQIIIKQLANNKNYNVARGLYDRPHLMTSVWPTLDQNQQNFLLGAMRVKKQRPLSTAEEKLTHAAKKEKIDKLALYIETIDIKHVNWELIQALLDEAISNNRIQLVIFLTKWLDELVDKLDASNKIELQEMVLSTLRRAIANDKQNIIRLLVARNLLKLIKVKLTKEEKNKIKTLANVEGLILSDEELKYSGFSRLSQILAATYPKVAGMPPSGL